MKEPRTIFVDTRDIEEKHDVFTLSLMCVEALVRVYGCQIVEMRVGRIGPSGNAWYLGCITTRDSDDAILPLCLAETEETARLLLDRIRKALNKAGMNILTGPPENN